MNPGAEIFAFVLVGLFFSFAIGVKIYQVWTDRKAKKPDHKETKSS